MSLRIDHETNSRAATTTLEMLRVLIYHFVRSHREEICHQRGESRRQTALSDEAQLEFGQTYGIVSALPIPTRYVEQVRLFDKHKPQTLNFIRFTVSIETQLIDRLPTLFTT